MHSQATTSLPKANIGLPVRNRHFKSARKKTFPVRKWALVKDDRKSFGAKLRRVPSYTFYRRILQKPSRRPFGRPIPVWGPAAVGEAP